MAVAGTQANAIPGAQVGVDVPLGELGEHTANGEQDGVPEVGVTITTVHRAPPDEVTVLHAKYGEQDGVLCEVTTFFPVFAVLGGGGGQ